MNFEVCQNCNNGNPVMVAGIMRKFMPCIMGVDGKCCVCNWKKCAGPDIFNNEMYAKFLFFNNRNDARFLKDLLFYLEPIRECPFCCEHEIYEYNNPNKLHDIFEEAFNCEKIGNDGPGTLHVNTNDCYQGDDQKLDKYYLDNDSVVCAYMFGLYKSGIYPISTKFQTLIPTYKESIRYFASKRGCKIIFEGWNEYGNFDFIFKEEDGFLKFNSPLAGPDNLMKVMGTFPLKAMLSAFDPFTVFSVNLLTTIGKN